jgi:hypothetical protein
LPVRVKKTRQNKEAEPPSDSIERKRLYALGAREPKSRRELEPNNSGPIIPQLVFFLENTMKTLAICTTILTIALAPAAAEAKGCIKGAIVGGVAGHFAGHGKVGAVTGCIIGRHEANKRERLERTSPSNAQGRI